MFEKTNLEEIADYFESFRLLNAVYDRLFWAANDHELVRWYVN